MEVAELLQQSHALQAELVAIRRHLHQIPEFGLSLPQTLNFVVEQISPLGEVSVNHQISSATLLIRGAKTGETVLLRADMDALAVIEDTGLPFASTNGFMHACGHDMHMAMAIGAARLIYANRESLAGNVLFFFQSGEEGHGGADLMLESNMHLASGEMPIAAYGLHVFSKDDSGIFATRPGALMASAGDILVKFIGQASHGSMPWLGKDPITPMVQAIAAIQPLVTKSFSAFDQVIVNVGWIKAGDDHTTNVVPMQASFGATIRTFSKGHFERIRKELETLMRNTASSFGVEVELSFSPASKVVLNTPENVSSAAKVAQHLFGDSRFHIMENPIPGGEDFASILEVIPGAFVFLGAGDPAVAKQDWEANHSNKARYDESVLADGAAYLAALAFNELN